MKLLRPLWLLGTIVVLALVLAACGGDGAQDPQSTIAAQASTVVPDPETTSTVETTTTVSQPQTTSSTTTTGGQESGDEALKPGLQTEGTKVLAETAATAMTTERGEAGDVTVVPAVEEMTPEEEFSGVPAPDWHPGYGRLPLAERTSGPR